VIVGGQTSSRDSKPIPILIDHLYQVNSISAELNQFIKLILMKILNIQVHWCLEFNGQSFASYHKSLYMK